MNTREMASEYRMVQWAQAIQERVAQGESIKDFCERRGISRNTYFYWQRKIRQAACQQLAPTSRADTALVPKGWAVCEAAKPVTNDGAITIEIGPFRVNAGAGIAPEELEQVLRVLVRLC